LWSDDLAIAEWWAVALPLINLLKTGISVTSGDRGWNFPVVWLFRQNLMTAHYR